MTEDELDKLKRNDVESYLLERYGSLHNGFTAYKNILDGDGNYTHKTQEDYFNFLDTIIDWQAGVGKV